MRDLEDTSRCLEFPRLMRGLVEELCCQAGRMTSRVEKDPPMLWIGLLCRNSGTQTHRVSLRCVKVVDFQVQMHPVSARSDPATSAGRSPAP